MNIIEPTRQVWLAVRHVKKAAKSTYGESAYGFYSGGWIMEARGWSLIKRTRHYTYMRAPEGFTLPLEIEIAIPSEEELLQMGAEAHEKSEEWTGRVGEWAGGYYPPSQSVWRAYDVEDRQMGEPNRIEYDPHFYVGCPFIWESMIYWRHGKPKLERYDRPKATSKEIQLDLFAELPKHATELWEGALKRVEANRYERDSAAREQCIAHFGAVCACCGFDFEKAYGEVAAGFIHVHHLTPISAIGEEYRVNPIRDLIPVCPNCHVVMHMRIPPYSVAEVKSLLIARGN